MTASPGAAGRPAAERWAQVGGSVLLLTGPPLFGAAFVREPWLSGLVRPFARPAIYAALAGAGLHLAAAIPLRTGRPTRRDQP